MRKSLDDLVVSGSVSSLKGVHVTFQQVYGGLPIEGALTRVHISKDVKDGGLCHVKAVYHPDIPPIDIEKERSGGISIDDAIRIAVDNLGACGRIRRDPASTLVIYPLEGGFVPAWRVHLSLIAPAENWLIFVALNDGRVLAKREILKRFTGRGMVFVPNPVVSLGTKDLTPDSNLPEEAYSSVALSGLDGSGYLRGEYIDTAGTKPRANEPSLAFMYHRDDRRFREVMAYYHIDALQRYLRQLGFNLVSRRVKVNASGPAEDNSYYDAQSGELVFGSGGVGVADAEDADIIVHEYAHAIMSEQVPGIGVYGEDCAMESGFCDFLAACYFSEENGGFNRECVGDWNGMGMVGGCVRRVDSRKHYPEDYLGVLRCDTDGEIWSSSLWDIYLLMGGSLKHTKKRVRARDTIIRLVLESHFHLHPGAGFRDGAEAILLADFYLYGGIHMDAIRKAFEDRGILAPVGMPADMPRENHNI